MSTNKPHDSVRSSPTLSTHNDAPDHGPTPRSDDLRARADLAEQELHDEGGDEPNDPPVKDHGRGGPPPPSPHDDNDPNEVSWDGPDDPANPLNFSTWFKWQLTAVCSFAVIVCTFASSAPSAAVQAFSKDFGVSLLVSNLITTLFLLGYVTGPLIWAPGSEFIGRRPIFIGTFAVVVLFQIGEALAKNIQALLICRFLSGVFAASPITNAGGVIADIWDPAGRGPAMAIFSASSFIGPICGPFIGGFLTTSHTLTWRWIFWILMILAGVSLVMLVLWLPETFAPVLLVQKARRLRAENPEKNAELYASHEKLDKSPRALLHRTLYRPFHMLLVEPMLQVVTVYVAVVYGLLYALFEAFPIIWSEIRGFSPGLSGLIFIGVGIGTTIGAGISVWQSREYVDLMRIWRGHPPPEPRLKGAMVAGPFFCIGILFLGWTGAYASIPWWVPAIATVIIGVSFTLIFVSFLTYIVDVYIMYSASALAANTIVRSAVGAAFPLFTAQMFHGLGVQWACTLLGCIGIVLAPSPFVFYKYGPRLRERSTYAPCLDIQIGKELEAERQAKTGQA